MPPEHESEPPSREPEDVLGAVPAFLRGRDPDGTHPSAPVAATPPALPGTGPVDPAALPFATIPTRHVARVLGLVLVLWIGLSVARQVGDAAASTARVDAIRASNGQLRADVAALKGELATISEKRYIDLAARAHGLGGRGEIPFALPANVPSLAPDAPGSASVRLGAVDAHRSPLESWLSILFGDGA